MDSRKAYRKRLRTMIHVDASTGLSLQPLQRVATSANYQPSFGGWNIHLQADIGLTRGVFIMVCWPPF